MPGDIVCADEAAKALSGPLHANSPLFVFELDVQFKHYSEPMAVKHHSKPVSAAAVGASQLPEAGQEGSKEKKVLAWIGRCEK